MNDYEERLRQLEEEMKILQTESTELKELLSTNTIALQAFLDVSNKLKVGLSLLGLVERSAVWCTKVGAALALTWAGWRYIIHEAIARSAK